MKLSRMQDIGGLRAVLPDLRAVRALERDYQQSQFEHELAQHVDYINRPKASGYRSVHLVYRYRSYVTPVYDGLRLELQLRSHPQHVWATAVETMGTFLGQALKSSEGEDEWLQFFALAGAAFAHLEGTSPVPGFEATRKEDVFAATVDKAQRLQIRDRLSGFTIAMTAISDDRRPGSYRLVILDLDEKTVAVETFARAQLEAASRAYSEVERRILDGANQQAVLVATGPLDTLRRAYPNYFLDTHDFIWELDRIARLASRRPSRRPSKGKQGRG